MSSVKRLYNSKRKQIHSLIITLNFTGIEIKTAHSLDSWNGGVLVMISGFVQTKEYNARRNFVQTFFLAPQEKGYFVLNDIFHLLDEEQMYQHPASILAQSNYKSNLIASNPIAEQECSVTTSQLSTSGLSYVLHIVVGGNGGFGGIQRRGLPAFGEAGMLDNACKMFDKLMQRGSTTREFTAHCLGRASLLHRRLPLEGPRTPPHCPAAPPASHHHPDSHRRLMAANMFMVGGYQWAVYFYLNGNNPEDNSLYVSVFIALASEGTDVRALICVGLHRPCKRGNGCACAG